MGRGRPLELASGNPIPGKPGQTPQVVVPTATDDLDVPLRRSTSSFPFERSRDDLRPTRRSARRDKLVHDRNDILRESHNDLRARMEAVQYGHHSVTSRVTRRTVADDRQNRGYLNHHRVAIPGQSASTR